MAERINRKMLTINEVTYKAPENGGDQLVREERQVARFRIASGEYTTALGRVSVRVCPIGADLHQKLIFAGIPTTKQRGIPGVFPESKKRRVVSFPTQQAEPTPVVNVIQAAGLNKEYVFSLDQKERR